MSFFQLSWKFFTRKSGTNELNFSSFLPIIGVSLGTITIILTFAIMDGLERDIFTTLKKFSGGMIINTNKISQNDKEVLDNYFKNNNINFSYFIERKAIFQYGENNKIINVRGLSNLKLVLGEIIDLESLNIDNNSIIIGNELSNRFNIRKNDSIKIISPLDIKFSSLSLPYKQLPVSNIFMTRLLDFDLNYVFISYEIGRDLFKKSGNWGYYLNEKVHLPESIKKIKNISIQFWDEKHKNLVGAMRMEKIAYVSFGFLLILISSFSLLSTMSIIVMQKISQIGILKTIGYDGINIVTIFFYFSAISGISGVIIGTIVSLVIKFIEDSYPFIHLLFGNYPFLEFPILLDPKKIILVCIISIIAVILASLYPAIKASKLNPIQSINIK
ncbi:MAG: hypothetical protein CMF96_06030 [Candidatus Marinimicrobia bacterium]|nr:hypothetical protein [Candidatus Neomarinimicrobiota bacterium]|tara:strand:+ start:3316 stop:4476 length:1161 start_codon:yes stop_codon:yes gene_type:complete